MSLWQTQSWQDMLIASGQTQEYFVIEQNFQSSDSFESGLKKKIFVEKRKVSLGEYGLFVIGYEGIIDESIRENLLELCIEENCLFAQIETLDYSATSSSLNHGGIEVCGKKGKDCGESGAGDFQAGKYYKKFIPPFTAVIDLTQSEDEILSKMKPKGRYNIKLAQKNGVTVKQAWKTPENILTFYNLMSETTSRDNFSGNTLTYYQEFLKQESSQLFFAEHEGELIAAGIFVQHEEVMYYYYGASSSQKRNLMAPYFLQWTVILHAKKQSYKLYDFLGIASPGEKNSPLTGVTDFKLKLTPDTRLISQSFLYIHKKWKYTMIEVLKKVRKK